MPRYDNSLAPRASWRQAFLVYGHRRVLSMLFLGFSAGLPYLLVFSTLSLWLKQAEVSRSVIGFFSWVGISYSVKVLWAPIIDRLRIPFLSRLLGRRRAWMLLAQLGIALGLVGMAMTDPRSDLYWVAVFALVVAFSSATQDISVDAFRIEAADKARQGAMAASYVLGYRMALLVAGAGALVLSDQISWPQVYLVMASLTLVGMITVLVISEPELSINEDTIEQEARVLHFLEGSQHWNSRLRAVNAWFLGAVVCPFVDFFERNGSLALIILLLISMFKISDITMGVMANPFYSDLGFSNTEIGEVTKVFGFLMTILGAAAGGIYVVRYGVMQPLLIGAVLIALTNLLFAYLASSEPSLGLLSVVIAADNLSGGFATSAFIAYLSSLTNSAYTATQYALFSSLMTLFPKIIAGFSGVVVDAYGYIIFFAYTSLMGVPAILLVLYLMGRANGALRSGGQD